MERMLNYKNLRLISLQLPEGYIREINRLVKSGEYPTRSEFIRQAVRLLLLKYHRKMNKYKNRMMYA